MKAPQILQLLPDVVRRSAYEGSVLSHLVEIMDEMHEPVEEVLSDFGAYADPYRCPSRFVPFLARWVGFGWLLGVGDSRYETAAIDERALRELVVHAAALAKERGTRPGLERMLALATMCPGFQVINDPDRAFAIEVRVPETARGQLEVINRIVRHEKPAFVTASVTVGTDAPLPLDRYHQAISDEESGVLTF